MNTKTSTLIILFIISALVFVSYYTLASTHPKYVSYITETTLGDFHPQLATILSTDGMDHNAVILHIKDNQVKMYHTPNIIKQHRLNKVSQFIKKTQKEHVLPNGDYFLSFNDAFRDDIGYPALAFATTRELAASNKIILIPDVDAMHGYSELFLQIDAACATYPWKNKSPIVFWRGAATGKKPKEADDTNFHRKHLIDFAKNKDFINAEFTSYAQTASFAPEFAEHYQLVASVPPAESLKYRDLLSIDGNSCCYSRMAWILYSNSILMNA